MMNGRCVNCEEYYEKENLTFIIDGDNTGHYCEECLNKNYQEIVEEFFR